METEIFRCACSSNEHQVIIDYDNDDNTVYCHIHLQQRPFWSRVKNGLKYIFGHYCRYGHWDEFIWCDKDVLKLKELIDKLEHFKLDKTEILKDFYLSSPDNKKCYIEPLHEGQIKGNLKSIESQVQAPPPPPSAVDELLELNDKKKRTFISPGVSIREND